MTTSSQSSSGSFECPLCHESVDRFAPDTWKKVAGWVGGPKKDHMRLREDVGEYAHEGCVLRLSQGQAADQPDIFEADTLTVYEWRHSAPPELPEVFK